MSKMLVGYTGFVGSNIAMNVQFDHLLNSQNIAEGFGVRPDLLVYAGIRAEKFLANKDPEADLLHIRDAIQNIEKINPKRLVLVSTIDVYKDPFEVNEDSVVDENGLSAYGFNRYKLEQWVEANIADHLIVRLPGLYGKGIKKNFIYDMIHLIPSMLVASKFAELTVEDNYLKQYYSLQENGYYKCKALSDTEKGELKAYFLNAGFSAMNFTDSRGVFQFYNLNNLWHHITVALGNNLKKVNFATEPILISEIYRTIKKGDFNNEIVEHPPKYDMRTKYDRFFLGSSGYIYDKDFVLKDILSFYKVEMKFTH